MLSKHFAKSMFEMLMMLSIKQDVIKDFKQAFIPIVAPVALSAH